MSGSRRGTSASELPTVSCCAAFAPVVSPAWNVACTGVPAGLSRSWLCMLYFQKSVRGHHFTYKPWIDIESPSLIIYSAHCFEIGNWPVGL